VRLKKNPIRAIIAYRKKRNSRTKHSGSKGGLSAGEAVSAKKLAAPAQQLPLPSKGRRDRKLKEKRSWVNRVGDDL